MHDHTTTTYGMLKHDKCSPQKEATLSKIKGAHLLKCLAGFCGLNSVGAAAVTGSAASVYLPPIPSAHLPHIPRIFLITDKAWSARADKLNRSLAHTHPGWPVRFFDDDMAEAFIKHHYPNTSYAKVFRRFPIPAHRADFFRYAALHAMGGYYVDADNRPVVNLKTVTRSFDFVTALDGRGRLIHNGFIAARPGSGITLRLLRDTAAKVRQSSLARYCYFVRSGLSVIADAIRKEQGRVRADTLYTAEGYNGSRRERVLFVSHDTRPTRHPNHTRAGLWACGLNQRRTTPAPAAEPRINKCECIMHVAVHPTNYTELEVQGS